MGVPGALTVAPTQGGLMRKRYSAVAVSEAESPQVNVAPAVADPGDLFARCQGDGLWDELRRAGYYAWFQRIDSASGPEVVVDGRRLVMMGSNNYLGLTTHPRVVRAAVEATARCGTGSAGSRFLNGNLALNEQLERRLALFHRREAAQVFNTGYLTNLGAISGLCGKGDAAVIDRLAHASLLDACRLAQAEVRRFRHNDLDHLDRVLRDLGPRPKLVAVDGVYSMDGDLAPLPELIEVCRRRGARLLVDDAHGLGVLGQDGRGVAEHFGVEQEVDLIVGTLSKAAASVGGYVAGDARVIEFVRHNSRPLMFTASTPPACLAAALEAIDVILDEPGLRRRLWAATRRLLQGLRELGYDTGASCTPIVPVQVGAPETTIRLWRMLLEDGIFANPVLPPAVPQGRCIMRLSLMATHTDEHVERTLRSFARAGRILGLIG